MSKKKNTTTDTKITIGGNIPFNGQKHPNTIIITQPKRFGNDISDYISAVRAAENVDMPQRSKLYDLYEDILADSHLTSVLEKRRDALLGSEIKFMRNGKPDDTIGEQIKSPWFQNLCSDILDARFWGFSLCQFFKTDGWVDYTLIPRKHVDPDRRIIKRRQTDITGISWDEYKALLFIGKRGDLGLLAKAAPWVLWKRNTTGDWSQFSEVFGMPIQEYTYETDDDDARQRAIDDASNTGSLAVFIHGTDTSLNLLEAGNKTGSADVYERLAEFCNKEISKLVLGNTLTTESSSTGTQALGTVHKKVEDKKTKADQRYLLNVLNYDMADIFRIMGIDTSNGEFCIPEKKEADPTSRVNVLTQLRNGFGLPMSDDYLYEEFGVEKPVNYTELKQIQRETAEAPGKTGQIAQVDPDDPKQEEMDGNSDIQPEPTPGKKKSFRNWLDRFFQKAPLAGGADLEW